MKIVKVRVAGCSKGINWHRHYDVELKNGKTIRVSSNEDVLGPDKYYYGSGEGKETKWYPSIKALVNDLKIS